MVDEEKVRIMTRIASYEQKERIQEIEEGGYYESDYIRSRLFPIIWSYTVAYALLLLLIALYHLDFLTSSLSMAECRELAAAALVIYILLILVSVFLWTLHFAAGYERSQKLRKEYYGELKKLEQYYVQNREGGSE